MTYDPIAHHKQGPPPQAPLRAVFITTTLSTGGAELMLLKLLQHLDRSRFEPSVVSLKTKGDVGPRLEALNIPVLELNLRPGFPNPLKLLRLVLFLRKNRPALVQTWMYHADLLGGLAARLAGCLRVVWSLRNSNLDAQFTKRTTRWVVSVCAAMSRWLPTAVLSCSERAREIHAAAGYRCQKFSVIPNGFDVIKYKPDPLAKQSVRAELNLPLSTLLVGLIARNDPQKNHQGFIEAAAQISRALPTVNFLLAGDGVDYQNTTLNAAIQEKGLAGQVHLLGRRDDVPRIMASLDVLALSSLYGEAFPNVLGEAMACAVPCVVTDVGDSAEIVGSTGRVVMPGDMRDLATQIVDLLLMPPQAKADLGQLARNRILSRFEISHVARRYEAFYESLAESS